MHGPEVQGGHPGQQRRRRRGTADRDGDAGFEAAGGAVGHDAEMDGGCAVIVRDPLRVDGRPDGGRIGLAQAHMAAAHRGHRPGEAPAVAVEHGHHPQQRRFRLQAGFKRLHQRVQVRTAVRVHDALRPSGRARGVIDRDRLLFVQQRDLARLGQAAGEEVLIGIARRSGVVDPDHRQAGVLHQVHELMVGEHEAGPRVLENVGDILAPQPGVDGHQHAARGRHAVMRLEQRRDVRREERHPVSGSQARQDQRRCEPVDPLVELAVGVTPVAVHDRDLAGVDVRAAAQEAHRRQLGPVGQARPGGRILGRDLLLIRLGTACAHVLPPPAAEAACPRTGELR